MLWNACHYLGTGHYAAIDQLSSQQTLRRSRNIGDTAGGPPAFAQGGATGEEDLFEPARKDENISLVIHGITHVEKKKACFYLEDRLSMDPPNAESTRSEALDFFVESTVVSE